MLLFNAFVYNFIFSEIILEFLVERIKVMKKKTSSPQYFNKTGRES